ncbi:MAG: helix-turn-helix transcriptional regulator [Anaerolineae bacterium]
MSDEDRLLLYLLADGWRIERMARVLCRSRGWAHRRLTRICRELAVSSPHLAVIAAWQMGIIR